MREDNNFLQGLYYDNMKEQFVESAGLYGQSKVQWLKPDSSDERVLKPDYLNQYKMSDDLFGEGMSPRSMSEFIVLTWKKRKMFILDRDYLYKT